MQAWRRFSVTDPLICICRIVAMLVCMLGMMLNASELWAALASRAARIFTNNYHHSCSHALRLTNATITRGSLSLAVDVIMFALPIPIIANLKVPFRRKIGLGIAFTTGLL